MAFFCERTAVSPCQLHAWLPTHERRPSQNRSDIVVGWLVIHIKGNLLWLQRAGPCRSQATLRKDDQIQKRIKQSLLIHKGVLQRLRFKN